MDKFEARGKLGVVLGYGQLRSYKVLDFDRYVATRGEARILTTRDVRFPVDIRYPFADLDAQEDEYKLWTQRFFLPGDEDAICPVDADDGTGHWRYRDLSLATCPATCPACLRGGPRSRHTLDRRCLRGRCAGHVALNDDMHGGANDDMHGGHRRRRHARGHGRRRHALGRG